MTLTRSPNPKPNATFIFPYVQVDNYTEMSRSPVLVGSLKPKELEAYPLVHLRMRQRLDAGAVRSFYEYISVLVLGIRLDVDAPTILIYLADFAADVANLIDEDQILSTRAPEKWLSKFSLEGVNPLRNRDLVDVYVLRARCIADKLFVEKWWLI